MHQTTDRLDLEPVGVFVGNLHFHNVTSEGLLGGVPCAGNLIGVLLDEDRIEDGLPGQPLRKGPHLGLEHSRYLAHSYGPPENHL
jgi:hypothetical protein